MENTDRIRNYLDLLKIRQKAYRRDVFLTRGVFLFALLTSTATLLFTGWNVRSLWLMVILDLALLASLLTAWTRLEITNEHIALVSQLQE